MNILYWIIIFMFVLICILVKNIKIKNHMVGKAYKAFSITEEENISLRKILSEIAEDSYHCVNSNTEDEYAECDYCLKDNKADTSKHIEHDKDCNIGKIEKYLNILNFLNKRPGFDDFLEEQGIKEEVNQMAEKEIGKLQYKKLKKSWIILNVAIPLALSLIIIYFVITKVLLNYM